MQNFLQRIFMRMEKNTEISLKTRMKTPGAQRNGIDKAFPGKSTFARSLLSHTGLSAKALARESGINYFKLVRFYADDDAKLSLLDEIFNKNGYNLVLRLRTKDGDLIHVPEQYYDKRLGFIYGALKELGLSIVFLGHMLGISESGIRKWFLADDLTIGQLVLILKKCELDLDVSCVSAKPFCETEESEGGVTIYNHVNIDEVFHVSGKVVEEEFAAAKRKTTKRKELRESKLKKNEQA